jgi:hypothetical protein
MGEREDEGIGAGMAIWDEPEEVVDLSLVPGGRRYSRREGAVAVNP